MQPPSDPTAIDAYLEMRERGVPALRHGCEKRVLWANEDRSKTPVSVVFVHGFSASSEELRPLPDLIANALAANLHFTRLAGHGQDSAAMGRATADEWLRDTIEAIDVGRAIGNEVIVISCSTGGTMVTQALAPNAQRIKASVFISPNYRLAHPVINTLINAPLTRQWAPVLLGKNRTFQGHSEMHEKFWTTSYPTVAVFTMADAMRACRAIRVDQIKTPAFFGYCEADTVVSAKMTQKIALRWGGSAIEHKLVMGPDDDAMGHLVAGDVFSPSQTKPLSEAILRFIGQL